MLAPIECQGGRSRSEIAKSRLVGKPVKFLIVRAQLEGRSTDTYLDDFVVNRDLWAFVSIFKINSQNRGSLDPEETQPYLLLLPFQTAL